MDKSAQKFYDINENFAYSLFVNVVVEQKRRREADAIMDAYLKSGKSLEEVMTFLKP